LAPHPATPYGQIDQDNAPQHYQSTDSIVRDQQDLTLSPNNEQSHYELLTINPHSYDAPPIVGK
jgi:hypothetical protein